VEAIWVGVDDTDSPRGGCTTWTLTEVLDEARDAGIDLIGEPRLVRLNPNIPWKTRGNAALAARFGVGRGRRRALGEVGGRPVWSFSNSTPLSREESRRWIERAWRRVLNASRAEEEGTDPVLVASDRALPPELYWNAVRDVVEPGPILERLSAEGAVVRVRGDPRGAVGASAAIAWPASRRTWELITYRRPERFGTPRDVDPESVRAAQRRHPELFLCHDARTRRLLVAPHTPCPILYGVRATRADVPMAARREIRSEPAERWLLFRTNQGTGDHLVSRPAAALASYRSAVVRGRVASNPRALTGGHVRFEIVDRVGTSLTCFAFEPTKTLPQVAQALGPGDDLRVWGSHGRGGVLRVEGIEVRRLARRFGTSAPPRCPSCGIASRSLGSARGFRCDRCRRRWPPEAARTPGASAGIAPGIYHPTPSARRHLAPLGPEDGR
jgi:tRNA(Ile2)-agmatinylcytidine synthase